MSGKLTVRQRQYIRKQSKPVVLDPSEEEGELNIVPFLDIVVNLIMFLLMTTASIAFFAQIEAQLPKYGRGVGKRGAVEEPPLNLNVTVTDSGVIVTGSGGKLAPGCETTASGRVVTVPRRGDGEHDWAGLTRCVATVKKKFPDEQQVIVSADPLVPYDQLVAALDAVRHDKDEILFPEVLLSAGVR